MTNKKISGVIKFFLLPNFFPFNNHLKQNLNYFRADILPHEKIFLCLNKKRYNCECVFLFYI